MAYWIHENGETIGPLEGNQVQGRAQPDTLVSHGQTWVRFDNHPDFCAYVSSTSPQLEVNQADHSGGKPQQSPITGVNEVNASGRTCNEGNRVTSSSASRSRPKTRVSLFTLMAVSGLLLLTFLIVLKFVSGVSSHNAVTYTDEASSESGGGISTGPNTTDGPETSSPSSLEELLTNIDSKGQATTASINDLEHELYSLSQQHPKFQVFGDIIDRNEDSVLIFGKAFSTNNDESHLGTVLRDSNLLVLGATKFPSPYVFSQENLYFVQKTTGLNQYGGTVPLRVYSANAPPDQVEVERQYQQIRGQIAIASRDLQKLKAERARIVEEIELRDWNAVKDDPLQLIAYSDVMNSRGDSEKAKKALLRSCAIAPDNVTAHVRLGQYYFDQGQHEDAENEYRTALAIDPGNTEILRLLGLLLSISSGNDSEAVALLQQSISDDTSGGDSSGIHREIDAISRKWGEEGRNLRLLIDIKLVSLNDAVIEDKYRPPNRSSGISGSKIPELQAGVEELKEKHNSLEDQTRAAGFDLLTLELNSTDDVQYWEKRKELHSKLSRQALDARKRSQMYGFNSSAAVEKALWREQMCSKIEQEARAAGITLG